MHRLLIGLQQFPDRLVAVKLFQIAKYRTSKPKLMAAPIVVAADGQRGARRTLVAERAHRGRGDSRLVTEKEYQAIGTVIYRGERCNDRRGTTLREMNIVDRNTTREVDSLTNLAGSRTK